MAALSVVLCLGPQGKQKKKKNTDTYLSSSFNLMVEYIDGCVSFF